jgi:hypothetical protein
MKTKKFKFDFNEDADPVSELRRYRAALSRKYKTVEALFQYYRDRAEEDGYVAKDGFLVKVADVAEPPKKSKPLAKPKRRAPAKKPKTAKSK